MLTPFVLGRSSGRKVRLRAGRDGCQSLTTTPGGRASRQRSGRLRVALPGGVFVLEEMLQIPLGRVQEVARDRIVLRLAKVDLADLSTVEAEEDRARVAEEDRRV